MKPIVVHRQDPNNVGDIYCNPLMYYGIEHDVIDIENLHYQQYDSDRPVIVGGGGLIENELFGDVLRRLLVSCDFMALQDAGATLWKVAQADNAHLRKEFQKKVNALISEYIQKINLAKGAPRIVWGAGHNTAMTKRPRALEWPGYLSSFDLVGLRDADSPYDYVPCASCLHPAFEKTYEIKNDIIIFEHKKQLIKSADFGKHAISRFINSGNNIEQTIEILGSANIIITNSYHGAYWGYLLGKKVIVVEPWSSKFFQLKPFPQIIYKIDRLNDLDQIIDSTKVHDGYLEECKIINNEFAKQVKEML